MRRWKTWVKIVAIATLISTSFVSASAVVNNTNTKAHLIEMKKGDNKYFIEGKATLVNTFDPMFHRLKGKIITFGFAKNTREGYPQYYFSYGWINIITKNTTIHLSGQLDGTLGRIGDGEKVYHIGIRGFKGNLTHHKNGETHFIGFAGEVGINNIHLENMKEYEPSRQIKSKKEKPICNGKSHSYRREWLIDFSKKFVKAKSNLETNKFGYEVCNRIFVEGKATDVYEFEYFSDYPPILKWILMLLTGKSGNYLAFGYQEWRWGSPPIERHSVGWVSVNKTTNLSGVLWGTLGIIGDGKGKEYWIGVDGFEGTITKYPTGMVYFRGYAKKVGIEAR